MRLSGLRQKTTCSLPLSLLHSYSKTESYSSAHAADKFQSQTFVPDSRISTLLLKHSEKATLRRRDAPTYLVYEAAVSAGAESLDRQARPCGSCETSVDVARSARSSTIQPLAFRRSFRSRVIDTWQRDARRLEVTGSGLTNRRSPSWLRSNSN
jgi:hypothetical protein